MIQKSLIKEKGMDATATFLVRCAENDARARREDIIR